MLNFRHFSIFTLAELMFCFEQAKGSIKKEKTRSQEKTSINKDIG